MGPMDEPISTALVVDDDADHAALTAAILRRSRFAVMVAHDGEEALATAEAYPPDIVILDVMMSYLTEGFDVARKLRAAPATARTPILLLTAVTGVFDVDSQIGPVWPHVDRVLEKPIDAERLLATVGEILKSRAEGAMS